ncbi:hypothetical protein MKW98_001549 [Papaver atlanticum]|uniref:Uncharacterized protein n=1 Tax=Papaver atlanticum TaxID=357466 RepID=A0AAD4S7X3_9MAGN|nr:hypothetical protein MKW98_001549 [Papaver atlanticum]
MGISQYHIYKAANDRPNNIGNDSWDEGIETRSWSRNCMLSTTISQRVNNHLVNGLPNNRNPSKLRSWQK